MVVELPICSVNTESRFEAVADSSSKMGVEDPLTSLSVIATRSSCYRYPGRRAFSSEIPDRRKRGAYRICQLSG
jgi:hypothetical protein